MNGSRGASIQECFADLPDARMEANTLHKLLDIVPRFPSGLNGGGALCTHWAFGDRSRRRTWPA